MILFDPFRCRFPSFSAACVQPHPLFSCRSSQPPPDGGLALEQRHPWAMRGIGEQNVSLDFLQHGMSSLSWFSCLLAAGEGVRHRVTRADPSTDQGAVPTDECGRPVWHSVCPQGWHHGSCWHLLHPCQSSNSQRCYGNA